LFFFKKMKKSRDTYIEPLLLKKMLEKIWISKLSCHYFVKCLLIVQSDSNCRFYMFSIFVGIFSSLNYLNNFRWIWISFYSISINRIHSFQWVLALFEL
jgi:hypothetical protein